MTFEHDIDIKQLMGLCAASPFTPPHSPTLSHSNIGWSLTSA